MNEHYWVLDLQSEREPDLGWIPFCIFQGGSLQKHLEATEKIPQLGAGVQDARIRTIDREEAISLNQRGLSVWGTQ